MHLPTTYHLPLTRLSACHRLPTNNCVSLVSHYSLLGIPTILRDHAPLPSHLHSLLLCHRSLPEAGIQIASTAFGTAHMQTLQPPAAARTGACAMAAVTKYGNHSCALTRRSFVRRVCGHSNPPTFWQGRIHLRLQLQTVS